MKITGTRSYILIEFDQRTLKIAGELTTTPAFYAYVGSIKNWEPPYEDEKITDDKKKEIITKILEQNDTTFEIIFEE